MLCDICGKNQATVHLTEIIDDQMTELHLCEQCAREKSMHVEQQFGLADLLAGLSQLGGKAAIEKDMVGLMCPNCHITYEDFRKAGRLGCGNCYNTFRKYLAPLLRKIHGSTRHTGKRPLLKAKKEVKRLREEGITELRAKLQKAVEAEEYEEAARLRDKIRALERRKRS